MRALALTAVLAALPTILSEQIQPPIANITTLPVNFGMLVFPGFQALDVFGPLDALSTLHICSRSSTPST